MDCGIRCDTCCILYSVQAYRLRKPTTQSFHLISKLETRFSRRKQHAIVFFSVSILHLKPLPKPNLTSRWNNELQPAYFSQSMLLNKFIFKYMLHTSIIALSISKHFVVFWVEKGETKCIKQFINAGIVGTRYSQNV